MVNTGWRHITCFPRKSVFSGSNNWTPFYINGGTCIRCNLEVRHIAQRGWDKWRGNIIISFFINISDQYFNDRTRIIFIHVKSSNSLFLSDKLWQWQGLRLKQTHHLSFNIKLGMGVKHIIVFNTGNKTHVAFVLTSSKSSTDARTNNGSKEHIESQDILCVMCYFFELVLCSAAVQSQLPWTIPTQKL